MQITDTHAIVSVGAIMGTIRKCIEDFKKGMAEEAARICDRITVIDGQPYAVFYKRSFWRGLIKKNSARLTKLPATFTPRGSDGGNMTYEEAVEAMRNAGCRDRIRPNPLDKLKF